MRQVALFLLLLIFSSLSFSQHSISFNPGDIPAFYVGEQMIPAPRSNAQIFSYIDSIHRLLESHKGTSITIRYGEEKPLALALPYLGRGQNGAVYEILGESPKKVIKISFGSDFAVSTCKNEGAAYVFWRHHTKNGSFSVPKEYALNPHGLFRIMEKIEGETLTKALIRLGLLQAKKGQEDKDLPLQIIGKLDDENEYGYQVLQIRKSLTAMLRILLKNPDYCTSLSPDNIFVSGNPLRKDAFLRFTLVDIGICQGKLAAYRGIVSFNDYLRYAANRLEKYLTSPIYLYERVALLRLLNKKAKDDSIHY